MQNQNNTNRTENQNNINEAVNTNSNERVNGSTSGAVNGYTNGTVSQTNGNETQNEDSTESANDPLSAVPTQQMRALEDEFHSPYTGEPAIREYVDLCNERSPGDYSIREQWVNEIKEKFDPTNNTPLDQFNIKGILSLDILENVNLSLTNMGLFVILSTILLIYLYVINNNFNKIIPNNTSAASESIYATVHGIVIGQINDKKGQQYFPFIFVLFVFILTNNLIGMVPYTFATTSHFILTFSLSFTIVLGATYLGLYLHRLEFFSLFVPSGCPLALLYLLVLIEFISYLSRPVSLGLRLAANVLSGHMLLNILSGFTYNIMNSGMIQLLLGLLPLAFVIAFSGLEVGVAFIQAQVFIVLSCSYIKDGLDLH